MLQEREAFATVRQRIIAANPELQERERHKLASLADGGAEALRRRDVPDPAARLAAETGVAVFAVAFERWTSPRGRRVLRAHMREALDELTGLVAERGAPAPR